MIKTLLIRLKNAMFLFLIQTFLNDYKRFFITFKKMHFFLYSSIILKKNIENIFHSIERVKIIFKKLNGLFILLKQIDLPLGFHSYFVIDIFFYDKLNIQ